MADRSGTQQTAEYVADRETFTRILEEENIVLVDFFAEWCGPCKIMAPTIDEYADESQARVIKVNVDDLPTLPAEYQVRSVPTLIAFKDGSPAGRLIGVQDKDSLAELVDSA